MQVIGTVREMRAASRELRRGLGIAGEVGLVPTMGALHAGHVSLMRAARGRCGAVVASLFVNPTQFAAGEDLGRYPRTFEEDCAVLEREGVDVLFAPEAGEMYPAGSSPGGAGTFVEVPGIGDRMDGASRPGHFRGVATVVAKLFGIVGPDVAFFGQKDAAQVAVLRAMVRDLNMAVELVVCPTVREVDGLALSSRNRYLNAEERVRALALSRGLACVAKAWGAGETRASVLRDVLLGELGEVRVDYAAVVDASSLEPVSEARAGALVAVAAWVGTTRLIDNVVLDADSGLRA